jgi:hypothetical protein
MPYVRDSFWRGREFTPTEQMQAEAVTWSQQVAGRRKCRPGSFRAVAEGPLVVMDAAPRGGSAASGVASGRNMRWGHTRRPGAAP